MRKDYYPHFSGWETEVPILCQLLCQLLSVLKPNFESFHSQLRCGWLRGRMINSVLMTEVPMSSPGRPFSTELRIWICRTGFWLHTNIWKISTSYGSWRYLFWDDRLGGKEQVEREQRGDIRDRGQWMQQAFPWTRRAQDWSTDRIAGFGQEEVHQSDRPGPES